jgi:hypothetical protein
VTAAQLVRRFFTPFGSRYGTKGDTSTNMDTLNFDAPQAESDRNYASYDSILQPQVILPAQFSDGHRRAARSEPLRRLMAAILEDAIRCFRTNINARRAPRRLEFWEAKQWFFGSEAEGPFAFENVCHVLDIDPTQFRRKLLTWRNSQIASRERSVGSTCNVF